MDVENINALEELRRLDVLDPSKVTSNDHLFQKCGKEALNNPRITATEALAIAMKCRMPVLKLEAYKKAIEVASLMTGDPGYLRFADKLLDGLKADKDDLLVMMISQRQLSDMVGSVIQHKAFDRADILGSIILAITVYEKALLLAPDMAKQIATPLARMFANGTTAAFALDS